MAEVLADLVKHRIRAPDMQGTGQSPSTTAASSGTSVSLVILPAAARAAGRAMK
jgi:hypothetical protein